MRWIELKDNRPKKYSSLLVLSKNLRHYEARYNKDTDTFTILPHYNDTWPVDKFLAFAYFPKWKGKQ